MKLDVQLMKVGDLVRALHRPPHNGSEDMWGIIVEVVDAEEETLPPVVKVMWHNGTIDKEWTDDLEAINEI
tara:strand:- start:7143 stop:7355 length:213 start_codon:yes stop_codon:yes gene_type:complete